MAKHKHLANFKAVYQSFALSNLPLKKFDYQFQTEPCMAINVAIRLSLMDEY